MCGRRLTVLIWLAAAGLCRAVIFESTSNATYNTTAPGGALLNSGWQYQGRWGAYLGTPIAPRFFLSAKHVGGSTNQLFWLDGVPFHPVRWWDAPAADLRLWEVSETFPRYAPLLAYNRDVGQPCVVFGRGTLRGQPVVIGGVTNGWRWGGADGVQRWGENNVTGVVTGKVSEGELLYATFDRGAGSNECHLSDGDSSGALFVPDVGVWKLAGINYAVDGKFSATGSTTDQFDAALLDQGGLYVDGGTNWTFVPDGPADRPSGFYSTRVAAHTNWILSRIDFLPGPDFPRLSIAIDSNAAQVSFLPVSNRLYRLERCEDLAGGAWTLWTNKLSGTNGALTVTDTNAPAQPLRFYRLGLDR